MARNGLDYNQLVILCKAVRVVKDAVGDLMGLPNIQGIGVPRLSQP